VKGEFLSINSPVQIANPTFDRVTLSSNLCSSKQILVPVQLLQDSAFDLESELSDAFAIRLGRILSDKYTTGSGSGEPQGLLLAGVVTNQVTAIGDKYTSGSTYLNSIGVDDLANQKKGSFAQ
jgi:HK97 family phage major capsid protein